MFRRSLQILLAATLLALAAIVGYASLRLDGAPETLARAEQFVQRREFARAIAELDLCERGRSLQQDPVLRERLWRLRLRANTEIRNHRGALRDVDNLLRQSGNRDLGLQLDRIRLLIASDDRARALQVARAFVADHPEHAAGLEVAAEACAALYQPELERLRKAVQADLGAADAATALAAIGAFVFRPVGDEAVVAAQTQLTGLYSVDTRLAARWPLMQRDLDSLRESVQEGLEFGRRCLERPDAPSTAAWTWLKALDDGGRYDDLLAACEIQRRRGDPAMAADIGLLAARSLLGRGAHGACIATVGRWLPAQHVASIAAGRRAGSGAQDLMLARLMAAWRLGDGDALQATMQDTQQLRRAGVTAPLVQFLTAGLLHYRWQAEKVSESDTRNSEANLRIVARQLLDEPSTADWAGLLPTVMPIYVELLRKLGQGEGDVLNAFAAWIKARPDQLAPRLLFVRHLLASGKPAAAAAELSDAMGIDPANAEVFSLRLQAARLGAGLAGQDGPALLAQCLKRRSTTPEVEHPIGYLLCAETAMEQHAWIVARDSARAAVDAFPQQRLGRLLEIDAMLAGGEAPAAALRARRALDLFPGDAALARAALRAGRAAGQAILDLLPQVLPHSAPDDELRSELLRAALADDPTGAVPFAAPVCQQTNAPADLRLLAARALCAAGRVQEGWQLLAGVLAESDALTADLRLDVARAITAWAAAAAAVTDDDHLATELLGVLKRTDLRDPAVAPLLFDAAARLAATHPGTAYELAMGALDRGSPADRIGAWFALAGRLAQRAGHARLCEDHLLAAITFADGRSAGEDLARLHLAQRRGERAVQVYRVVDAPADAALAVRCGEVDLGAQLALAAAQTDAADLFAQATLAAIGKPSRTDWQPADVPLTELRLDLLALLHDTAHAAEALARAQYLVQLQPSSLANCLLLARAHWQAGDATTAATVHAAISTITQSPLLWREIALAADEPGYTLAPEVRQRLVDALLRGGVDGSPVTSAFALRCLAEDCDRDGRAAMAVAAREQRWVHFPRTVSTAADIEAVVAEQGHGSAVYVLEQALPTLTGTTRTLARTRLYELYDRRITTSGAEARPVYETALRHLASEGPHGCIVALLLDHADTFPTLKPDTETCRRLLQAQLELAGAGRDPGPWLQAGVQRLLALQGAAATRRDLDEVLARHPTCLPLWHARTVALVHQQQAEQALDDLRTVLRHADAPDATLPFLVLAGANGVLQDGDYGWLLSLPPKLRDSEQGAFARGLLALRRGNPDEAVPLLEQAPPQADGLHLFAVALAHLQSRALEGGDRAAAAFARLAADYPSSSLARYAGSFAVQLAPRSATAAASDVNR